MLRTRKQRRAWGKDKANPSKRRQAGLEKIANRMRQDPTEAEAMLLQIFAEVLPRHNIRFLFQHVLAGRIVDFYLPQHRLIIEVDGGYHYFRKGQQSKDRARQCEITQKNRDILRFDNEYVENFPRETIMAILAKCGPQYEIRD